MVLLQVILAREVIVSKVFISQCPVGTHQVFSMNTEIGIFLRKLLFFKQK